MGLGMPHLLMEDDEEPRRRSSLRSYSVIDQLFKQLTALSTLLESAVELSSTLEVQHTAAQSTISAFQSKVTPLEGLVQAQSQQSSPIEAPPPLEATLPLPNLTH
jgi:predicted Zn-dependent protease